MVKKYFLGIKEYNKLYISLAFKIYEVVRDSKIKYVYGVPRGGCLLADRLSLELNLQHIDKKMLKKVSKNKVIIVDDILESGKTRTDYKQYRYFYPLINKKEDKWKDRWIEFWYENTEQDDKDLFIRLAQRLGVDVKC